MKLFPDKLRKKHRNIKMFFLGIIKDIKSIDKKELVWPYKRTNINKIFKNVTFWTVLLMGLIPLLIITFNNKKTQLTLFSLFFAIIWGIIFKIFICKDKNSWKWPITSLFFTGFIGLPLLSLFYRILPSFYLQMADSSIPVFSLLGYIFQIGLWEELFKAIPIFIIAFWGKISIRPDRIIIIGIFSGLGFSAFENLQYGVFSIINTYNQTRLFGVYGLFEGVQDAIIVTMLRLMSLMFFHALLSGIVGYFVALAKIEKQKKVAIIFIGLAVSVLLHGLYNWLFTIQTTASVVIVLIAFVLFYGYNVKLNKISNNNEILV